MKTKKQTLDNLSVLMNHIVNESGTTFNKADLLRQLNGVIAAEGLDDRLEAHVHGDINGDLLLQIRDKPAIDRLAEVGARYRAEAAYERGLLEGRKLLNGEVSVDDLTRSLEDDPL